MERSLNEVVGRMWRERGGERGRGSWEHTVGIWMGLRDCERCKVLG
jgi:hypothetical protein